MSAFRLLDRFTGQETTGLPAESVLGRWLLIIDAGVQLNGLPVSSGEFLLPDSNGEAVVQLAGDGLVVLRPGSLESFPAQEERQSFLVIGAAQEHNTTWVDWEGSSPLEESIPQKAQILPFEHMLNRYLDKVKRVCRKPVNRLTGETARVPIGRARRIPTRSYEYLANHTEDWQYRSLTSVVPRRIISTITEELLDFYENRLAVRLVELVHLYLHKRLKSLDRDKQNLISLEFGTHARQDRVFSLLSEGLEVERFRKNLEPTTGYLKELYRRVLEIQDLPLYNKIPATSRKSVPAEVRATNILTNDRHYRYVNILWKHYLYEHQVRPKNKAEQHKELQAYCQGFDRYSFLLVVRALKALGFEPSVRVNPQFGQAISLNSPYGVIELHWQYDHTIQIFRNGRLLARVIPLAEALTRGKTADEIVVHLHELAGVFSSARLKGKKVRKTPVVKNLATDFDPGQPEPQVFILYPGAASERQELPGYLQRLANSPGNDLTQPEKVGFIPVSPYELGCVERVGRAMRWAIFSDLYHSYPLHIDIPVRFERQIFESASWLKRGERLGEALVVRWVDLQGREYRAHDDLISDWKGNLVRKGLQANKNEIDRINQYQQDFIEILSRMTHLRTCPVCGKVTRPENFHPDEQGAFSCTCEQRNCATWGLRRCGGCHQLFPFLDYGSVPNASEKLQADWVDLWYGMDILAVPCLTQGQTYLCPHCGSCGRGTQANSTQCQACREFRTIPTE